MVSRLSVTIRSACLVCAGLLAAGGAAAAESIPAAASAELARALQATGPHASLADASAVFGKLVGSWRVDYLDFKRDGTTTRRTGRFAIAWVLDGRALQDFWVVDPSGTRKEREVYTDVFYLDPKTRTWQGAFLDPEHGGVIRFTGAVEADRLALHTPDLGAADSRWTYDQIRPDSFVYRDEASDDGGKTWRLRSEYHMTRERPAP